MKKIYFYEDGVEEGKLPFKLEIFDFFPYSLISVRVEWFNGNYEIEAKLNPFWVSGKDIEDFINDLEDVTKQFYIENNQWIIFVLKEENNQQHIRKE